MKPYDLLIFDWDGTLMDSAAKIVACLRAALEAAALEPRDDGQLRHIIGLRIDAAVDYLYPNGISPAARQIMIEEYRRQFLYVNCMPAPLFDGVENLLEELEGQGYLLAVATGKGRHGLNQVLRTHALERRFHCSRCADETASKPHPAMLYEILGDLAVPPERALMIGDTQFDIEMARNAGMDAVAVAHGAHDRDKLMQKEPLVILDHVTNLLSWLPSRVKQAV